MSQQYFDSKLKIFALNSNRPLAEKKSPKQLVYRLVRPPLTGLVMVKSGLTSKKVFVVIISLSSNQLQLL